MTAVRGGMSRLRAERPSPAANPTNDPDTHPPSLDWIAEHFPGSSTRVDVARERWAQVSDSKLLDARRDLAMRIRYQLDRAPSGARQPLADRALLIELAESANEMGGLLIEVDAIGVSR
jgi:hypothetical protein